MNGFATFFAKNFFSFLHYLNFLCLVTNTFRWRGLFRKGEDEREDGFGEGFEGLFGVEDVDIGVVLRKVDVGRLDAFFESARRGVESSLGDAVFFAGVKAFFERVDGGGEEDGQIGDGEIALEVEDAQRIGVVNRLVGCGGEGIAIAEEVRYDFFGVVEKIIDASVDVQLTVGDVFLGGARVLVEVWL